MMTWGREGAPIVPGVPAGVESAEVAAVRGSCCDDGGVV
jgi:hypothetical protein